MKIALLQLDIQWGCPAENIRRADRLIESHPDMQLYVLPEMWSTGFNVNPVGYAEDEQTSVSLQWMRETARKQNCALCGSLAVRTAEGEYRNRLYFVTPEQTSFYDKRHLFTYGGEDEYFTAGQQQVVVEWLGVRFLLLVCYDLRFPVWSRYGRAGEYDAIIYVANWPQSRQQAWNVLTHARAIENQSYVIAVNRVGDAPGIRYQGGSMLIDPIGRTVAVCTENTEQLLEVTLSIEKLLEARRRFKVLNDRDV